MIKYLVLFCMFFTGLCFAQKTVNVSTKIQVGKAKMNYKEKLPFVINPQHLSKTITISAYGKGIPSNLLEGKVEIYMLIEKGSPEKIETLSLNNNQISFTVEALKSKVKTEKGINLEAASELIIELPKITNANYTYPDAQRSVVLYLNLSGEINNN